MNLRSFGRRFLGSGLLSPEEVAMALYRGFLDRAPEAALLNAGLPDSGPALERFIQDFRQSEQFRAWLLEAALPRSDRPDLLREMPEMYRRQDHELIYTAATDADIARMESLIEQRGYYDSQGVWSGTIDLDKQVTAAIARGLGARSCFELGCFTGPVLSLLAEAGVSVVGSEVSHAAFVFAYPNIRGAMLYGDLLSLDIDRRFDVVLCMDVLEHISPLKLDRYIERLAALLADGGFIYLNSPIYGADPAFGTVFQPHLQTWRDAGDASFWRDWPCDDQGWPQHGHLVWASTRWWTDRFAAHGLVRDHALEQVIHRRLAGFFDIATARRSLFLLRRDGFSPPPEVAAGLDRVLASLPGLP